MAWEEQKVHSGLSWERRYLIGDSATCCPWAWRGQLARSCMGNECGREGPLRLSGWPWGSGRVWWGGQAAQKDGKEHRHQIETGSGKTRVPLLGLREKSKLADWKTLNPRRRNLQFIRNDSGREGLGSSWPGAFSVFWRCEGSRKVLEGGRPRSRAPVRRTGQIWWCYLKK